MRALCVSVVVMGAIGCGQLDTADQVHDLRLLGMSVDHPEVILMPGPSSPNQLQLSALIADPKGGGRSIHYVFSTCAQLDPNTSQCTSQQPDEALVAEGDASPTDGVTTIVSAPFVPAQALLNDARALDPYHGFGGLQLPVQLEISAGNEDVIGIKRVVFTTPTTFPPPAPNTNPALLGVDIDGESWGPSLVISVSNGSHTITPIPDTAKIETYSRQTFQNEQIQFTESWRYDFFADVGKFTSTSTGGTSNLTGVPSPPDNTWSPCAGTNGAGPLRRGSTIQCSTSGQKVTFWIVVRDGRGGETWAQRDGQLP